MMLTSEVNSFRVTFAVKRDNVYGDEVFQNGGFQSRKLPKNIKERPLEWRWVGGG
jgi:hypothetical protein